MNFGLDHIRLRGKMFILYFLCVFIPIIITNLVFNHVTTNNVRQTRIEEVSRAVEQIYNEFLYEVEDAIAISSVFYTDYNLNDILERKYEHPADYVLAYDSYYRRILSSYTPVYTSVQNIKIYINNPTMLHSGGIGFISEEVEQSEWYRELKRHDTSHPIFVRSVQEDQYELTVPDHARDTFSVIRRLNYYTANNQWEKILKIDLRTAVIHQIFNNLNLQGEVYILNKERQIEFTTDPAIDWVNELISYEEMPVATGYIEFEKAYSGISFLEDWSIVAVISESEILNAVKQSRKFVIILASINIIIPTLIIVWITRTLNVRLARILHHMKRVKNQNFDIIKGEIPRDEIGQLTGEFNRMTMQIKRLIDDVYIADIAQKNLALQSRNAQLRALQSQISPHFLFNAMETIRMRSLMKHEHETANIIHNLAKIFRNSLVWNKDMVSVAEEMEFINCFLEIQQYRFGDKQKYDVQVAEDALPCLIPKMTFLPFVENASIHGVEPVKMGGMITLRIKRTDQQLIFQLEDNGVGMDEETIERLYSYLDHLDEMGDRIGIQNVLYRLKLYYDDRFSFEIDSEVGKGTKLLIVLPIDGNEVV